MEKDGIAHLREFGSSHRLPTISASQALQKLIQPGGSGVATGLQSLDLALNNVSRVGTTSASGSIGGYAKGKITEIYGPPAAGKTALALQAAARALMNGSQVVWIDASKPLFGARLEMHLPVGNDHKILLTKFHHYTTPTLPHLLALICHPPPAFAPANTTLLVLDGISSLFTAAYPENPLDMAKSRKKSEESIWLANRRYAVMTEFLSKLTKLAAVRDLAAVLISQTSLRVRTELGAVLRPAIWTKSWGEGIQDRIIVFRDFFNGEDGVRRRGVRFVAVVKNNGVARTQIERAIPFRIEGNGCKEVKIDAMARPDEPVLEPRVSPQKRKRKRTEIADSQSEDSEEFLDPFDRDAGDEGDPVTQLHVSHARGDPVDPDLATFEAAMESGFDDV